MNSQRAKQSALHIVAKLPFEMICKYLRGFPRMTEWGLWGEVNCAKLQTR
jgi:hypothetical protein